MRTPLAYARELIQNFQQMLKTTDLKLNPLVSLR